MYVCMYMSVPCQGHAQSIGWLADPSGPGSFAQNSGIVSTPDSWSL